MMLGRYWSGLVSTTRVLWGAGVERGVWLVGVGLAHCWVLKHQAPRFRVGCWWFWFLPLPCHASWVWWGVGGVVV